jgi:mannitol-1-phosphate/altronate dehydrogenase
MMSEGEGIQHACGQFEHAIDSVNLARVKKKRKKGGKHGFRIISCSNKKDSSMMLSAVW